MSEGPGVTRSDAGQASVEHVGLMVVVALLIVVGGAMVWAPSIGNAVHSGIRQALCVAGGDRCADFHVQRPCLVRSREDSSSDGVRVLAFRIGKDQMILREEHSDGTVSVTRHNGVEGGVGLSLGGSLTLGRRRNGKGGIDVSAEAQVEGRLLAGRGNRWDAPDGATADRLIRRLVELESFDEMHRVIKGERELGVRDPDVEIVTIGVTGSISGEVSGPLEISAPGSGFFGLEGKGTRDRRTGNYTVSLGLSGDVAAALDGPIGLQLDGEIQGDGVAEIVMDRDLRPLELRFAGAVGTRAGTRRREAQVRLDVTRPELRERVKALLGAVAGVRPRAAVAAAGELGRWAGREGWIDLREYRTDTVEDGTDADLGLGLRLGLTDTERHETWEMTGARTRPPGGVWETRPDCPRVV
ncbi:MAG: hypothetical protein AB7G37_14570 [Solirubrobacteraceae bacterium]